MSAWVTSCFTLDADKFQGSVPNIAVLDTGQFTVLVSTSRQVYPSLSWGSYALCLSTVSENYTTTPTAEDYLPVGTSAIGV